MKLRPYQLEAVDAVFEGWRRQRSVLVVLPTGTGKTVLFAEVARRIKETGKRVLVIAHRDELISQGQAKLEAAGLRVEVEKADRYASKMNMSHAVFASVQTLKGARLAGWRRDEFAAVIVDEAHHMTSRSYRAIVEWFGTAKVLGVTATPDRGDSAGLYNVIQECVYKREIAEMVRDGWLVDIVAKQITVEDFDISAVRSRNGDLSEGDISKAINEDKLLHRIAAPLVKEAGSRPTVIFMPSVASSMRMRTLLGGYVSPECVAHIDGTTPEESRRDILRRFAIGDIHFLSNCAVLTEGWDAPHTACIAICRPTKSRALYAQMVGRGTRPSPGKKDLLLLDFQPETNGVHKLVTPKDILGGESLPPDISERSEHMGMVAAVDAWREEMTAAYAAEKAEKARLAEIAQAQRQTVYVETAYEERHVTLYGPATEKQIAMLERHGVNTRHMSKRAASDAIDRLLTDKRKQPCTPAQSNILHNKGLRSDLTRGEADEVMGELRKVNWRVGELPEEMRTKYKRTPIFGWG